MSDTNLDQVSILEFHQILGMLAHAIMVSKFWLILDHIKNILCEVGEIFNFFIQPLFRVWATFQKYQTKYYGIKQLKSTYINF